MPYVPDPPWRTESQTGSRAPQGAYYVSREKFKAALDFKETARNDAQIDRALAAATAQVESLLHRSFFPWYGTRYFDWPPAGPSTPWRLWLDANELISIASLEAGGVTIASDEYLLYPASGPPFTRVEIDLSGSAAFSSGSTHQDAIAITGVFGYGADTERATITTVSVEGTDMVLPTADSSTVGVGDVILVDTEYMVVTGRSQVATGQTLQADVAASAAAVSVPVGSGAGLHVGETVLVDAERMLVVDIAGNTAIVKRAAEGSVLAAHSSGATVYAPRSLSVTRAALAAQEGLGLYPGEIYPAVDLYPASDSTAAAHTVGTVVKRHVPPPLVEALTLAEALNLFVQQGSAYMPVRSGKLSTTVDYREHGLEGIRSDAIAAYGRRARVRAV